MNCFHRVLTIGAFTLFQILPTPVSAQPDKLWLEGKDTQAPVDLGMPSFAPVIDKLGQAVVNISTEPKEEAPVPQTQLPMRRGQAPFGGPTPFDFFFQNPPQQRREQQRSLGSGFVIHPDGYIVTNNHVVENTGKVQVTFKNDKHRYDAKVIGADEKTDLALLKVDAGHKLDSVVMGDSNAIRPGDWVIAIGNPFLLGHTATVGIVSATSRKLSGAYDDFIQTDASINPGNSGGPLFNARGEVVGVNTAIFSPGRMGAQAGFNIGIGFAIPVNTVKDIIAELHKRGKVTRGWLGVLIQPVDQDTADALQLAEARGALVANVLDESPAKRAGIQRGDVIVRFNGTKLEESDELPSLVARTAIGSDVAIEVLRKGKLVTLNTKVDELKDEVEESSPLAPEASKLGITVQDLTPDIARSLGIDDVKGVIVTSVAPGSEADNEGFVRGDVILEINGEAVAAAADFRRLTKTLEPNKPLLILINRNNTTLYVTIRPR